MSLVHPHCAAALHTCALHCINPAILAPPGAVFYDKRPEEIGPQVQAAYVNAIKQLVPGGQGGLGRMHTCPAAHRGWGRGPLGRPAGQHVANMGQCWPPSSADLLA